MRKFRATICLLFLLMTVATIAQAGGEKKTLFPDLAQGLHIYRYDWDVETCVLYVAEMSRHESALRFEVALANAQVLGKETVRSMANRRTQRRDRRVVQWDARNFDTPALLVQEGLKLRVHEREHHDARLRLDLGGDGLLQGVSRARPPSSGSG